MFRFCLVALVVMAGSSHAVADTDTSWLTKILGSQDQVARGGAKASRADGPTGFVAASGETGVASYYWQRQRVASGGWFNPDAMTAAHKSLPFGTRVRVTHMASGRSVTVMINDRGPFVQGRIIDLSRAAARSLGMTDAGVATVRVQRI